MFLPEQGLHTQWIALRGNMTYPQITREESINEIIYIGLPYGHVMRELS